MPQRVTHDPRESLMTPGSHSRPQRVTHDPRESLMTPESQQRPFLKTSVPALKKE